MEGFVRLIEATLLIMQHKFTIYGFTISFWDMFVFSCIAGIIGYAINRLFGGD